MVSLFFGRGYLDNASSDNTGKKNNLVLNKRNSGRENPELESFAYFFLS